MPSRFKRGGGAPEYGMVGVNLGNGLRRDLERLCRRHGISLTDYVRASVEQRISQEWFRQFQGLRYLVQSLRCALGTDFATKTLGVTFAQNKDLHWQLRELLELIERKADEQWMENLSSAEREELEKLRAAPREPYRIPRRPGLKAHPHWSFEIREVERILNAL
jgi:hypothetical protein